MTVRPRGGFTLIEILVALVLGGTALSIGYGLFAATTDQRRLAAAHGSAHLRAVALRDRLTDWIGSAHMNYRADSVRFSVIDFDDDGWGDELTFVTTSPTVPGAGFRSMTLAYDAMGQRLLSVRTTTDAARDTTVLAGWIGALRVRVLPNDGEEWLSAWSSTVLLPAAVRVQVTTAMPDSLDRLAELPLVIPIFVTQ